MRAQRQITSDSSTATFSAVIAQLRDAERALDASAALHETADELARDGTFALHALGGQVERRSALAAQLRMLRFICGDPSHHAAPRWLLDESGRLADEVARMSDADGWILQELMLTDLGVGD